MVEVAGGAEVAAVQRQLVQANAEVIELRRKLASAQEQARPQANAQNAAVKEWEDGNGKLRAEIERLEQLITGAKSAIGS